MNALLLAAGVFIVLGISIGLGMILRDRLPSHHLNPESKEVIRLATAIVGTLSALAWTAYSFCEIGLRRSADGTRRDRRTDRFAGSSDGTIRFGR
jgi:hypothetical protein